MWMKRRGGQHNAQGRFPCQAGGLRIIQLARQVKAADTGFSGARSVHGQAAPRPMMGTAAVANWPLRWQYRYAGESGRR